MSEAMLGSCFTVGFARRKYFFFFFWRTWKKLFLVFCWLNVWILGPYMQWTCSCFCKSPIHQVSSNFILACSLCHFRTQRHFLLSATFWFARLEFALKPIWIPNERGPGLNFPMGQSPRPRTIRTPEWNPSNGWTTLRYRCSWDLRWCQRDRRLLDFELGIDAW